MNFNDSIFIAITKALGYEVEKETIESLNFDKEELYSNDTTDFENIPDRITGYVGVLDGTDSCIGIYLDQSNPTTEGIIEIVLVDDMGQVIPIGKEKLEEVLLCLKIVDMQLEV